MAKFEIKIASIPEANVQWFKNGKPMMGENNLILTIQNTDESADATYKVLVKNSAGSVISREAHLVVD